MGGRRGVRLVAAMTFYGGAYLAVVAFGEVERDDLLAYVVAGGASWSLGGLLFLATAWRLGRGGRRHPRGGRHPLATGSGRSTGAGETATT